MLQRKAWHPQFRVEELSLDTIKQSLIAARAAEAAKELQATGQNLGNPLKASS